jgi:hypothetical protein
MEKELKVKVGDIVKICGDESLYMYAGENEGKAGLLKIKKPLSLTKPCELENCPMVFVEKSEIEPSGEFLEMRNKPLGEEDLYNHSDKSIYYGCIALMGEINERFLKYLDFMDINQEDAAEEERWYTRFSNFEIVQRLMLFNTEHSGGGSTRAKCDSLGIDSADCIEFGYEGEEE